MKKIHYFFIFIIFSLLIVLFFILNFILPKKNYPGYEIISYQRQRKKYQLLVADTPVKWERGLMYYKKLKGVDGMIFIFPDKKIRRFWNKNTYLDLDIYWLDDNRVVGKDYLPSIIKTKEPFTISSKGKVNKVVEIIR